MSLIAYTTRVIKDDMKELVARSERIQNEAPNVFYSGRALGIELADDIRQLKKLRRTLRRLRFKLWVIRTVYSLVKF